MKDLWVDLNRAINPQIKVKDHWAVLKVDLKCTTIADLGVHIETCNPR